MINRFAVAVCVGLSTVLLLAGLSPDLHWSPNLYAVLVGVDVALFVLVGTSWGKG